LRGETGGKRGKKTHFTLFGRFILLGRKNSGVGGIKVGVVRERSGGEASPPRGKKPGANLRDVIHTKPAEFCERKKGTGGGGTPLEEGGKNLC